jgi:hypothetical protein
MHMRSLVRSFHGIQLLTVCLCVSSVLIALVYRWPYRRGLSSDSIRAVLRTFTFVGQNPCQDVSYHPHGTVPLTIPTSYREGVCYTFLFPNASSRPVYEIIEQRLRDQGTVILHSPESSSDSVQLVIGGPLFHIDFIKGPYQGKITAVQDPIIARDATLRREWKSEAFVLFLRR